MRPLPVSAEPSPWRADEPFLISMTPAIRSNGANISVPAATSHALTAVPTLAPSNTICAILGFTRQRSANEAVINAVAVKLWSAMVASSPDRIERRPLLVLLASPVLSRAPNARVTPSLT